MTWVVSVDYVEVRRIVFLPNRYILTVMPWKASNYWHFHFPFLQL